MEKVELDCNRACSLIREWMVHTYGSRTPLNAHNHSLILSAMFANHFHALMCCECAGSIATAELLLKH